jgi:hypothetical protein
MLVVGMERELYWIKIISEGSVYISGTKCSCSKRTTVELDMSSGSTQKKEAASSFETWVFFTISTRWVT